MTNQRMARHTNPNARSVLWLDGPGTFGCFAARLRTGRRMWMTTRSPASANRKTALPPPFTIETTSQPFRVRRLMARDAYRPGTSTVLYSYRVPISVSVAIFTDSRTARAASPDAQTARSAFVFPVAANVARHASKIAAAGAFDGCGGYLIRRLTSRCFRGGEGETASARAQRSGISSRPTRCQRGGSTRGGTSASPRCPHVAARLLPERRGILLKTEEPAPTIASRHAPLMVRDGASSTTGPPGRAGSQGSEPPA